MRSVHLLIADWMIHTIFSVEKNPLQDPVHIWKAGPGEVMNVDFFFQIQQTGFFCLFQAGSKNQVQTRRNIKFVKLNFLN